MIEFLLILVGVLLAATVGAALEYYRQIRKAQREYEKAKEAVEDVVLSFNRELKQEADKLEIMAFKVEGTASKADTSLKRIDIIEKKIAPFEAQVNAISENNANILARLTDVDTKMRDIGASHETLKTKTTALDEQVQKFLTSPEVRSEAVIPIKKDKAMAALTDTELAVLEMLSMEGSKTAPEVKEKVQLSREHTARLMKKLYEEGYLERETGKIPFKYSVKKEMEKLLKKTETPQT
ncbi:MAG TPA: MarR family transcriptional regulator [Candidatus Bathyarchaeia archaeon]|nr:MarR family transcriptional regulator [Candidatus Bathyarchaeia archaeon]